MVARLQASIRGRKDAGGVREFFFSPFSLILWWLMRVSLVFFSSQAFPALLVSFLAKHKRSPELNDKHLGLVSSFFIFSKALERPTMVVCDVGVRSPCEPNGELLSRFRYARKVFQLISFFVFQSTSVEMFHLFLIGITSVCFNF